MPVSFNDVSLLVSIFVIFFMALVILRFLTYRPSPQKKPIIKMKKSSGQDDFPKQIKDNNFPKQIKTKQEMLSKDVSFEFSEEFLDKLSYEEFIRQEPPVPWGYNDIKITAMYRDPHWIYAYWELTDQVRNIVNRRFGPGAWENSRPVLRIYNVTGIDFNGNNAVSSFDVGISYYANNHYLEVSAPNQTFCIDLGRILPNGTFYCIARSNYVTMPRDSISDVIDKNWPPIEQLYEENFAFGDYSSPQMETKK